MTVLLHAEGVSKRFAGLLAVNDVFFEVEERSIVSLIGPNGAGKTTLFNMLTGLYKPSSGRIVFGGRDIAGRRPDKITTDGIARTFQNIRLLGTMTALENVVVGRHSRMRAGIFGSIARTARVRREERAARERPALIRRPCADPRAQRARVEVCVAFLGAGLDDSAFDAYLAFELDPVKEQACMRIGRQILPFSTFVIREEDEAALVHALDKHDAGRRIAACVDGGERHCVGLGQPGVERLLEPSLELADRIGVDTRFIERAAGIVFTEIGEGSHVLMRPLQSGSV